MLKHNRHRSLLGLVVLLAACRPVELYVETRAPALSGSVITVQPSDTPALVAATATAPNTAEPTPLALPTEATPSIDEPAPATFITQPSAPDVASFASATPAPWATFSNAVYALQFQYPAHWVQDADYSRYYHGPDGFFELLATNSQDNVLANACQDAMLGNAYGSAPTVENLTLDGQEACLIVPSADQTTTREQAVLIVRFPQLMSNIVPGVDYAFLVLLADPQHIRGLASTLAFLPSLTPTFTPTPSIPTTVIDGVTYYQTDELTLAPYHIQVWHRAPGDCFFGLATIEAVGQPTIQIQDVCDLGEPPTLDLTGEGEPDVVFLLRSGGSRCCWGGVIYNLGATPTQVFEQRSITALTAGNLQDLDSDGRWEIVTRAEVLGPPCSQPSAQIVFQYQPGAGYQPAGPRFPAAYATDIARGTQSAEGLLQRNEPITVCGVSDLMLAYLFSGQAETGHAEFNRLYTASDAAAVWDSLVQAATQHRLYVP